MPLARRSRRSGPRLLHPLRAPTLLTMTTVLLLLSSSGCGGATNGEGAVLASTGDLWAAPQRYEGRRVRTTGVVLRINAGEPDEHYVLEGTAQRRVELRGADPDQLSAMLGRRAEVIGRFHFTETTGLGIEVDSIKVVG